MRLLDGTREVGARIANLMPAWATNQVPGQSGLCSETLSQKTEREREREREREKEKQLCMQAMQDMRKRIVLS
jgi:hypothetical protein